MEIITLIITRENADGETLPWEAQFTLKAVNEVCTELQAYHFFQQDELDLKTNTIKDGLCILVSGIPDLRDCATVEEWKSTLAYMLSDKICWSFDYGPTDDPCTIGVFLAGDDFDRV